jgi:hypothetical protein
MSLRYLSLSQLSDITGKDRRTVAKRLAAVKPHSEKGRAILYDAPEAIEAIFLSDSVEGMDKKLLRVELAVEEERLQKLRIENGRSLGELVAVDQVAKAVEKEYSFVRAQVRSIPSKMAKPLSMVTDPNEIYSRLTDAVDECLTELTMDTKYADAERQLDASREAVSKESQANIGTITTVESSGMGRHESFLESGSFEHSGSLEDGQRGSGSRSDVSSDGAIGSQDHSDGTDPAVEDGTT